MESWEINRPFSIIRLIKISTTQIWNFKIVIGKNLWKVNYGGEAHFEDRTDAKGKFVERKNRFLGVVDIGTPFESKDQAVHIRDPGRLNDILYEGNTVVLKRAKNEDRKTNWDLIAGKVDDNWVLINSGYHRIISERMLNDPEISPYGDVDSIFPEERLGESVIDFLLKRREDKVWIEVKGCTLTEKSVALFPDAPTTRGTRHVEELKRVMRGTDSAGLIVLIFRPEAECFAPNKAMDPLLWTLLKRLTRKGSRCIP